jgi:archaellum component FlaF (FlaF/FlaG flagellin family)
LWTNTVYYAIGDIVRHGGYLYVAAANNYASVSPAQDAVNWNILSKGVNFVGTWSAGVDYKTGDVVRRGGNLYIATADTTNDGSSLDYLDASNWNIVSIIDFNHIFCLLCDRLNF